MAAKPTPLDRIISWVNPRAGLARHAARQLLARAYEAASPRDTWRPRRGGASANADHFADAATLRTKARFLVQNVPYIAAGMGALVAQTVGTGIRPRSTAPNAQAEVADSLWARWVKECDADGRCDFYGMQAVAYRAMEQDGEVMLRLRPRFSTDGFAVPLQLQLLEIDWLDTSRTQAAGANQIVNGIEYDTLGRKVAYWLWDQHPGDITLRRGARTQSTRVPASSIIHLYNPERPGQGRGFTRLAPVIARVRDLQLYEDAELARKNLEARLSVLASGDAASMANPEPGALAGSPALARQTGSLGELASGGITEVPAGMNITVVEPKPAGGHVEYVRHQLHLIAAGMGVTYEMMTGDMSQVNYSSARVRLMDLRRQIEQVQWLCLVPNFLEPVWQAFCDAAQLAGKLRRIDGAAVEFSTPKWEYVNPADDVRADLDAIGGGLQSMSETIRRRGYNPKDVMREMQSDFETLSEMKVGEMSVLDVLLLLQRGRVVSDVGPQQGASSGQRGDAEPSEHISEIKDLMRQIQRGQQLAAAPVPPAINVSSYAQPDMEPITAFMRQSLEAMSENITRSLAQAIRTGVAAVPAPIVNFRVPEQPAPNFTNNITVQPAAVDMTLALPPRKTTTDVSYNSAGDIVRTVAIESDAK